MENAAEQAARHLRGYFQAVAIMRDNATKRGDTYDAAYWAIELETEGELSSAEIHKRAIARTKKRK